MLELIPLVPFLPLVGFVVLGLFGSKLRNEQLIGWLGSGTVLLSFLLTLGIFFELLGMPPDARDGHVVQVYSWLAAGSFSVDIAYLVDPLSLVFTLIITGVGFLIHVYSIGYMHGDEGFFRFFAYLNLFIFMMLNLVLADNFLLTFLGWEGVGLASYLLIGFWYKRKFPGVGLVWTGDAARKAFIVNRVGDFGMLVAMFILFTLYGSLNYLELDAAGPTQAGELLTIATLLLFLGCCGKSAQIPLFVWLPDAMAGPTSVSALIHAATMVTSGIFLIARNATLFALSPITMEIVAIIGILTALLAATMGIFQNDIKKVLAYSTVSQLGFMFAALGVGAFTAAVFHVMTHAFFKACLFLGSGSVIHAMHEEQDIQKMGGLKKYMPSTYKTFLISSIAIAGIPPLAGFFSKDEILWYTFKNGGAFLGGMGGYLIWTIGALAALCTAFYMFRLVHLTFHGKERFDAAKVHPHESPATMTMPLWILAVLAALGGFLGYPHALGHFIPHFLHGWLDPVLAGGSGLWEQWVNGQRTEPAIIWEYFLMGASVLLALVGILLATRWYNKDQPRLASAEEGLPAYRILFNKYYIDELYQKLVVDPLDRFAEGFLFRVFDVKLVDGFVNGTASFIGRSAEVLRRLQTGVAQNYALVMLVGIIGVMFWLVLFRG